MKSVLLPPLLVLVAGVPMLYGLNALWRIPEGWVGGGIGIGIASFWLAVGSLLSA